MQQNRNEFIEKKLQSLEQREAAMLVQLEELRAEIEVYRLALTELARSAEDESSTSPNKKRIARYIKPDTIMNDVLDILTGSNGMIALDILARLNEHREKPLLRTSLSPQLSRLKAANIIELNGNEWRLVGENRDEVPMKS